MLKKIRKLSVVFLLLMAVFSLHIVHAVAAPQVKSDPAYANFRNVRSGSIGRNNLYRSHHPANGSSRSWDANRLAKEAGINTILNLCDSKSRLEKYFKEYNLVPSYYYRTLYARGSVYTANMGLHFKRSSFRRKVAEVLRFAAQHRGPYLVHCAIGRDRTGFVIMVMESLSGVSYDYILEDYTKSNMNLQDYSYEKSKEKAVKSLNDDFHYMTGKSRSTDWSKENLILHAKRYLKKGGMTESEIAALQRNLSASFPTPAFRLNERFYAGLPNAVVDPETPDVRNLSIYGKTILTREIRAGKQKVFHYRLEYGRPDEYEVECDNSSPSRAVVRYCGNGILSVYGRKEGTAVLRLHSRSDHAKRVKLILKIVSPPVSEAAK